MLALKLPGLHPAMAINSIIWVQGNGNYTWFYFTHQPKYLSATTLKWVEAQLPGFIRVHKSGLINPTQVAQLTGLVPRSFCLRMSDGTKLLVACRRVELVHDQLDERACS